jgi:glutaredoxin
MSNEIEIENDPKMTFDIFLGWIESKLAFASRKTIVLLFFLVFLFFQMITQAFCSDLFVYTRPGCPHCAKAKIFLTELEKKHPEVKVHIYDIWEDPKKMEELRAFVKEKGIAQMGVPFFRSDKGFLVGFEETPDFESKILSLASGSTPLTPKKTIKVPIVGTIILSNHTPIALAVILGLVDGFNPCAMWVLLILLSLLVHLKSRSRIFFIAGYFVLISGFVYFLFMGSILQFYDFIGFSRKLQVIVGIIALVVAFVHIKDFFLFKVGVSFSIPEKYKVRIAQKAAKIAREPSLWVALVSVTGLAIFVNFIELMCTAGLPAVFAQILAQNKIVGFSRFLHLLIYIACYMLDDSIMVLMAVWTLTQTKLQEKAGKWLKLVSGIVLLLLAVMMIFFPDSLNFGA